MDSSYSNSLFYIMDESDADSFFDMFVESDLETEEVTIAPSVVPGANLYDMPNDMMHYIFAFIGPGHYLFVAETCQRFHRQYREAWPGDYTLIRAAAASIPCIEWVMDWTYDFRCREELAFLISGAVRTKKLEVLNYMFENGWFRHVYAPYFAKFGHVEVLIFMWFKGTAFDPSVEHGDFNRLGYFLDPYSEDYDAELPQFFADQTLCAIDMEQVQGYFREANKFALDGDDEDALAEALTETGYWRGANSSGSWVGDPYPTSIKETRAFLSRRLLESEETVYKMFLG